MSARAPALLASAVALAASCAAAPARATGFTDIGQDLRSHVETAFEGHGYLRVRAEALSNLDLDRGLDPSGQPLYPVPLGDPNGQTLFGADMRLRADLAVYAWGGGLAVKVRLDAPDDIALGSEAVGVPSASISQRPVTLVRLKRAYGEALTPVGLLAAGRMGSHWGLGMLTNGGDCADCDSGDAADRVAFVTPIADHIWGAAFDFSASGPIGRRPESDRAIDLGPTDDVRTVTFAVLRFRDELARERRARAGKITPEYGAYFAHRWQNADVPADYLPTAQPQPITRAQLMARGYTATALDVWARLTARRVRVELEAALLLAKVEQASLIPGVLYRDPVESAQFGAAIESDIGAADDRFGGGLDLGYASGDPAPGFGANPKLTSGAPRPGAVDGPQADPPRDNRVDNFRFHPDYRVDRILFREIVGTVTDAVYVRPHVRWTIFRSLPGALAFSVAGVASWAIEATSAPGGKNMLGVEVDPTLAWESRDGFAAALEYAALFPMAGLDNPAQNLDARPAQLVRGRLMYVF